MKLSIITVSLNAAATICDCIESVVALNETDYEYLIIDGMSTDGTVEIAESYRQTFQKRKIPYSIFTEADLGIYDAMNKGVGKASGEWILFMNADDRFYDDQCICGFMETEHDGYGVIYGDTILKEGDEQQYWVPNELEKLKKGMGLPFCHQSAFVKKTLLIEYPFDVKYKIAGDVDFFLRLYMGNINFRYIPGCISVFSMHGVSHSQKNMSKRIREGKKLLKQNGCYTFGRHIEMNAYLLWFQIKPYLPENIYRAFHQMRVLWKKLGRH